MCGLEDRRKREIAFLVIAFLASSTSRCSCETLQECCCREPSASCRRLCWLLPMTSATRLVISLNLSIVRLMMSTPARKEERKAVTS